MTAYADIKKLNWSSLKLLDPDAGGSPLLYQWRQTHPRPDTPALQLGRAITTAILEPDRWDDRYLVPEPRDCEMITKGGKGKQCLRSAVPGARYCRQHGGEEPDDGREVLTPAQAQTVERCQESLSTKCPEAVELLAGAEVEKILEWTVDGVAAKGRVDAMKPMVMLADLKSTSRPLQRFFQQAAELGYHGQLAWYRDGAISIGELDQESKIYIPVVQTVEPYDAALFRVPRHVLGAGRDLYRRLLDTFLACTRLDEWPGAYPGVPELDLPSWAWGPSEDERGF